MKRKGIIKTIANQIRNNKVTSAVISIAAILCIVMTLVVAQIVKNNGKHIIGDARKNAENQVALSYGTAEADTNTDYVQFSAFFTREVDGKANKLAGTAKHANEHDNLFVDLNILSEGYLQSGATITVQGGNFKYNPNVTIDNTFSNIQNTQNGVVFTLGQIDAGTQKVIAGEISAIINNANDYTKVSTITLKGNHISNNGTRTELNVVREVTVDWYGDLSTKIEPFENDIYYNYDNPKSKNILVNFAVDEEKQELILKDNVIEVEVPQLNGKAPEKVECVNQNVETEYDQENNIFKMTTKKSSEINEITGEVTTQIESSNVYTVLITYPQEAFEGIENGTSVDVKIKGYYTAYNNSKSELNTTRISEENPNISKSNEDEKTVKIYFQETPENQKSAFNFDVTILGKTLNSTRNVFEISKEALKDWANDNQSESRFIYTVEWDANVRKNNTIKTIKMSEGQPEVIEGQNENVSYGDKIDERIIDECTFNTGVYFENANDILGEEGVIRIYDNDVSNSETALLATFTSNGQTNMNTEGTERIFNWNSYNSEAPFNYTQEIGRTVKHIRLETTKVNSSDEGKYLKVFNVKEIQKDKFVEEFLKDLSTEQAKEKVENLELLYTYLQGIAEYEKNETIVTETANKMDVVHFNKKISVAGINIEPARIPTGKELKNVKIKISVSSENESESLWQNGKFIVEMPKEIAELKVNSYNSDNRNIQFKDVQIIEPSEENDKYLIEISTENNTPAVFELTLICDILADYRIGGGNENVSLYFYNELTDKYNRIATDDYDVNKNESKADTVGIANTEIEIVSSQELITYETVTNFKKEQGENQEEVLGGEVIAPQVAYVENEKSLATINVVLDNRYSKSLKNIKILGRTPTEGNKSIINQDALNSATSTQMQNSGIIVPEELEGLVKVYYSTNAEAAKPGESEQLSNDWKELKDFNENEIKDIKSFLIDFEDTRIDKNKKYTFSYDVSLANAEYNMPAYSTHAVYYDIETENGDLSTETEPKKIGVRKVETFNLKIKTVEKGTDNPIIRATYRLSWIQNENGRDVEKSKLFYADNNGEIFAEDIIGKVDYTLEQINVSEEYIRLGNNIEFAINENNVQFISGENLIKEKNFSNNTLDLLIENRKHFILEKIGKYLSFAKNATYPDSANIAGVKFAIKNAVTGEYATDYYGSILGAEEEINGTTYRVVETNSDGIIELDLPEGLYKAIEVYCPGHNLPEDESERTYYFGIGESRAEETIEGVTYPAIEEMDYLQIENKIDEKDLIEDVIIKEDKVSKTQVIKTLRKLDSTTGKGISGVVFDIFKKSYSTVTEYNYINTVTTGSNGEVELDFIDDGDYYAIEKSVPNGYELPATLEERKTYFTVGSKYDVPVIEYIEDLINLREEVNKGNTYEGQTVYLVKDLDMTNRNSYRDSNAISQYDYNKNNRLESIYDELNTQNCDYGLLPIGETLNNNGVNTFKGTFDGCGNALINFKIGQGNSNTGLFGCLWGGKIINLEMRGNLTVNGDSYVGAIVGYLMEGSVENCCIHHSTRGDIIGNNIIGGLVGFINNGYVKNCFNSKDITTNKSNVGGIVGYSYNNGYIINCYNLGNITGKNYIGGIVGQGGNVTNCFNDAEITGEYYISGIGCGSKDVKNCYNIGKVYGKNTISGIGGISINNSYNIGKVESSVDNQAFQIGTGTVTNCYYPEGNSTNSSEKGIACSLDYMKNNQFTQTLNNNKNTITSVYELSTWRNNGEFSYLAEAGVSRNCIKDNNENSNVYIINTAEQLRDFSNNVMNGRTSKSTVVYLEADLDLSVLNYFNPIGTETNPFRGKFYGKGHKIYNLSFNNYSGNYIRFIWLC